MKPMPKVAAAGIAGAIATIIIAILAAADINVTEPVAAAIATICAFAAGYLKPS